MPSRTAMPRDEMKHRDPRTGEPISDIIARLVKWFGNHREGEPVPTRVRKLIERLRLFLGGDAAVPEAEGVALLPANGQERTPSDTLWLFRGRLSATLMTTLPTDSR